MRERARSSAVTLAAQRRYWRETDARIVVHAWRRSGETQAAFAVRYGLDPKRLGRWAARLARGTPEGATRDVGRHTAATVRFHPVRVVATKRGVATTAAVEGLPPIEVAFAGGVVIRVPSGVAPDDLRQVLAAVAAHEESTGARGTRC